jgi:hypothetical protein
MTSILEGLYNLGISLYTIIIQLLLRGYSSGASPVIAKLLRPVIALLLS